MESQPQADGMIGEPGKGFGLSANALKLIAIIAMAIDHIAHIFVPEESVLYIVMRCVGRITGPTMFYLVSVGYRHTRSVSRYTLRLAVFAVVSYVPFIFFRERMWPNAGNFYALNVIYTILIGLLAIRVRNEVKNPAVKVLLLMALALLVVSSDWGVLGLLIMLVFDYYYGDFRNQAVAYSLLVLTQGGVLSCYTYPLANRLYSGEWSFKMMPYLFMQLGMFLPLVLLRFYNGERGRGGVAAKWGFYIFYPLHLLLLGWIHLLLYGN